MSDLSPGAQAVLDAYVTATGSSVAFGVGPRSRLSIAAALRAAVEQCANKREVHPDSLLTESIIEADDILAIAAELENQ